MLELNPPDITPESGSFITVFTKDRQIHNIHMSNRKKWDRRRCETMIGWVYRKDLDTYLLSKLTYDRENFLR